MQCTVDTVQFALESSLQIEKHVSSRSLVSFKTFAWNVIQRSQVQTPVLLATLVYMNRAKAHLTIHTDEWACERVFLGALIAASKVCYVAVLFILYAHNSFSISTTDLCSTFIGQYAQDVLANGM